MHQFAQRTSSNFKTRQLANARSHRPKRSGNEQFGLRPVDWIQKRARAPAPEAPARRRTRRIFAGAAFFRIFNALTGVRRATARTRRRGGARGRRQRHWQQRVTTERWKRSGCVARRRCCRKRSVVSLTTPVATRPETHKTGRKSNNATHNLYQQL